MSKVHMWLDRHPILSQEDEKQLEQDAALHEFGESRLPREEAEAKAYKSYKDLHHAKAAAYHLARARVSTGDEAQKHQLHYGLHVQALGLRPEDGVPDVVKNAMNDDKAESPVKFASHKADNLLGDSVAKNMIERLQTLQKAATVGLILQKAINNLGLVPAFLNKKSGQIFRSPGLHDPSVLPEGDMTDDYIDGFVDRNGVFMNRIQAAQSIKMRPHFLQSEELEN